MSSRHLALAVAALAAAMIGCGGGDTLPAAEAPANPPAGQPAAQDGAEEQATGDVQNEDFEEPLGNYGTWLDDPRYGRMWQPADDVAGNEFTPYASDGSWVANEDGGWEFQSKYNDDWGWATYHYGRWVDHDEYGWVWLPGTEWAPSWVEWRYGGGYVGYVAWGPEGVVWPEERWTFVEERRFAEPGGVWAYRVPRDRVHTVYAGAAPVERHAGAHYSHGPAVASIRAAGGAVRSVHSAPPSRAAVRAAGKASVQRAAAANRPKPATNGTANPSIRKGPKAGTKASVAARAPTPAARVSRAGGVSPGAHPAAAPAAHPAAAPAAHHEPARPPEHHAAPAAPAPAHASPPPASHAAAAHPTPAAAPPKPKPAPAPAPAPKPKASGGRHK